MSGRDDRNKANWIAGWFIQLFLLTMTVLPDPFMLRGMQLDPWQCGEALLYSVWFMVLGMSSFVFLSIPRIWIGERDMVIVNPLRCVTIPLSNVVKVDDEGKYLKVHSKYGTYTAWGTERSNQQLFRDSAGVPGRVANRLSQAVDKPVVTAQRDNVTWRKPTRTEVVFAVIWISLLFAGVIFGKAC